MQPEAATVSITRHLDLRPSFFGQPERKAPRLWATAGFYVRPCLRGKGKACSTVDGDRGVPRRFVILEHRAEPVAPGVCVFC
jgi:hypothetical protein